MARHRVLAFCGSLRAESSNMGLLRMAERLAPPQLSIEVADWAAGLPLYNPDFEGDVPQVGQRWRAAVVAADALILGMPEYNHGPSAHGKNAIDWVSRPYGSHELRGKTIAILSSGERGGGRHMQAWLGPILSSLGNTVIEDPSVTIINGADRITVHGATNDPEIEELVAAKMRNLFERLQRPG
jgi:chromate reductase, NAD(P)H dehydrogenase (quinone)